MLSRQCYFTFWILNGLFVAANAKLGAPLLPHLSFVITCQVLSSSEPLQITSASSPVVGMSVYGSGRELSWPADARSSEKPGF